MTLTIHLDPEQEARLNALATAKGVAPTELAEEWLQAFLYPNPILLAFREMSPPINAVAQPLVKEEVQAGDVELTRSMMRLSESVFARVWDNDEDAVYDSV